MKSLILSAIVAGGMAATSAVLAQDVASLSSTVQTKHLVFLDKDGLSPTAKDMLRTLAGSAASARNIEVSGAPFHVDAVKRQLVEDGVSPNVITVRQGPSGTLPSLGDGVPDLQDRGVEIRVRM